MVRQAGKRLLPDRLREILENLPPFVVAFSGGLDSRFLAHAAKLCGCDFICVHASGPHVPKSESALAKSFAASENLVFSAREFDPLALAQVRENGRMRCYHCKKALLAALSREGRILCDGTNADDLRAFRPGLRALEELGVVSPLARAGLAKHAIRDLALKTGLASPAQRARPCLLTRFAYGLEPDKKTLGRLEEAEAELARILGPENDFRLRLLPEPVLHVHKTPEISADAIAAVLRKYGFGGCTVKSAGAISGFFDRPSSPTA